MSWPVALLLAATASTDPFRAALAGGIGAARASVAGPVSVRLRVGSATLLVLPSDKPEVRVIVNGVSGRPGLRVALYAAGSDRIDVEFDGRRRLQQGQVRLWVPRKSRLDLGSLDGPIAVRNVGGEVRIRGMSGDVDVLAASQADIESIDGEVDVLEAAGPVAVRTISGNVTVTSTGSAPRLDVETESGNLDWRGACGKGCHLDADTVSGQLRFALDRKASSFELRFISHQGKLRDLLGAKASEAPAAPQQWSSFTYLGKEGEIECETFSSDVSLQPL